MVLVQGNEINYQDMFYSNVDNHRQRLRGISSQQQQQEVGRRIETSDDNYSSWLTPTRFIVLLIWSSILIIICSSYLIWILIKSYRHTDNMSQLKEKHTTDDDNDSSSIEGQKNDNTEKTTNEHSNNNDCDLHEKMTNEKLIKRDTLNTDDIVVDNADFSEHSVDGPNVNIIFRRTLDGGENDDTLGNLTSSSTTNNNNNNNEMMIPRISSCKSDSSVESQVMDAIQQIVQSNSRSSITSNDEAAAVPSLSASASASDIDTAFVFNHSSSLSTMLLPNNNINNSTNNSSTTSTDRNIIVVDNLNNEPVVEDEDESELESVASFHDVSERTPNVLVSFLNDTLDIDIGDELPVVIMENSSTTSTTVLQSEKQLVSNTNNTNTTVDIPLLLSSCPTIVEKQSELETDTSNNTNNTSFLQTSIDTQAYERIMNDASDLILTVSSTMNMSQLITTTTSSTSTTTVSPLDVTIPIQNTTSAKKIDKNQNQSEQQKEGVILETLKEQQQQQQQTSTPIMEMNKRENDKSSPHSFTLFQLAQTNHQVLNTPTNAKEYKKN